MGQGPHVAEPVDLAKRLALWQPDHSAAFEYRISRRSEKPFPEAREHGISVRSVSKLIGPRLDPDQLSLVAYRIVSPAANYTHRRGVFQFQLPEGIGVDQFRLLKPTQAPVRHDEAVHGLIY